MNQIKAAAFKVIFEKSRPAKIGGIFRAGARLPIVLIVMPVSF
jgi:hypothetical protein